MFKYAEVNSRLPKVNTQRSSLKQTTAVQTSRRSKSVRVSLDPRRLIASCASHRKQANQLVYLDRPNVGRIC